MNFKPIKPLVAGMLAILALTGAPSAYAYDFKVENEDGVTIYYGILDELDPEVRVTFFRNGDYSGHVTVPARVAYEGVEYEVVQVGSEAFMFCDELESVTLPESIKKIGESAFSDCPKLVSVNIPPKVTKIEDSTFSRCTSFEISTVPANIERLDPGAFFGCTSIKEFTCPDTLREITGGVFGGCTGIEVFHGRFASDDGKCLISYGAPDLIGFAPAGVKEYSLPMELSYINSCAFYDCTELESLVIGPHLSGINYWAFYNCRNLSTLTCLTPIPPKCNSEVFKKVRTSSCILYVPDESVELYKNAPQWGDFENIRPVSETGVGRVMAENGNVTVYDLSGREVYYGPEAQFDGHGIFVAAGKKIMK